MKKSIIAVLLLVCVISSSFLVVNALPILPIPKDICPVCANGANGSSAQISPLEFTFSTTNILIDTTPCSHHPGYTDSIYRVTVTETGRCDICGYTSQSSIYEIYNMVKCGYDGTETRM